MDADRPENLVGRVMGHPVEAGSGEAEPPIVVRIKSKPAVSVPFDMAY